MRLSRFLQEPAPTPGEEGKPSVTRLVFVAWAVGVLAVWVRLSLKEGHLAVIPDSVMYILGILMTGKVVQRNFEGDGRKPPERPPAGPPPA
ncbi:MAG TPA: hypothetical protein VM529_16015 [Gemmata sp.]|nr:hypothetical protein [Gemmata sp.]